MAKLPATRIAPTLLVVLLTTVSISRAQISDGLRYCPATHNYYELIRQTNINWSEAREAASARFLNDFRGYLATITSPEEQAFLAGLYPEVGNIWFGGSDVETEGEWKWMGGPEAGTVFWRNGTALGYTNWAPGEPNNGNREEHFTEFNQTRWNDTSDRHEHQQGYIVEYNTQGEVVPWVTIYVNPDATGAGNGSSWDDALTDLQDALTIAKQGDQVWAVRGTYVPGAARSDTFLVKAGVALYGGFAGTEAAREDRDPAGGTTVLSGDCNRDDVATAPLGEARRNDGENAYHVVTLEEGATLDGITVTGGRADGGGLDGAGAGVYVTGSSVTARSVVLQQNLARRGAGMYVGGAGGISLTNCLISENLDEEAGAVYCAAGTSPVLVNCTIAGNSAGNGAPGLYVQADSSPRLTNCIAWDGAIESLHVEAGAMPTVAFSCIESAAVWEGTGNTNEDPLFAERGYRDDGGTPENPSDDVWVRGSYRLRGGSSAIDAGTATGAPSADLLGKTRPCGGAVDMGAYEYCAEAFSDSFDQPAGTPEHWTIYKGSWSVLSQELVLKPDCLTTSSKRDDNFIWAGKPPRTFAPRRIRFTVQLTNTTGHSFGRSGGVMFCAADPTNRWFTDGYLIGWIDRDYDYGYGLRRYDDGKEVVLVESTGHAYPLATQWEIDLDDTSIRFLANGVLVMDVHDATYREGYLGFVGYCNGTKVEVDDVRIEAAKTVFVDVRAVGAGDGSSWHDAFTDLGEAVAAAQDGDEVWVAGGTYIPGASRSATFLVRPGVSVFGGFTGTETEREGRDPAAAPTILSGDCLRDDAAAKPFGEAGRNDAENCFHVVTLREGATLDRVTVTGGRADGAGLDGVGAGLLVADASVMATDVIVRQNQARSGAGVYIGDAGGIFLSNSLICENANEASGTIYCAAGTRPVLINCTIAGNSAGGGTPGVYLAAGSSPRLANCIVWNEAAESLQVEAEASPRITFSCIESAAVWPGNGNTNEDPRFRGRGHRDDRGTPEDTSDDIWVTGSYEVELGSSAIDAGTATGAPSADLLGIPRPCGDAVDMGAYEYCEAGDFYIRLPHVEVSFGETAHVQVVLDFDHNPDTAPPGPVQAWSYGVCHDPTLLAPIGLSLEGTDTGSLNEGAGPAFLSVSLPATLPEEARNGITVGVIIDSTPPLEAIPAMNGWRDAVIAYAVVGQGIDCLASSGATTGLSICDTLDVPPLRTVMTVGGDSIALAGFDAGSVEILCTTPFKRGDGNRDGELNIADAVCLLCYLFGDSDDSCKERLRACLDVGDANDDGAVNIGDVIAILGYLFNTGPDLAPPLGACGPDPTGDALGCDSYPAERCATTAPLRKTP